MNIVITDGNSTNPGDLSWEAIEQLGTLTVYGISTQDQLAERVADADIIISNKIIWDAKALDCAPHARLIALLSTGYNVVDLDEARRRGIAVANVPAYSTPDVAQMTFALLLELTLHAGLHTRGVVAGKWAACDDFCYWDAPLMELAGKTMGIVGMGSIGQSVARIARAFGMDVVFANRSPKPECECEGVRQAPLPEVLSCADVVSLHVPATAETTGLIDARALARMKRGAILVNTARGTVIDEAAVADALRSGHIGGFGADVVAEEPMRADNPLLVAAQQARDAGAPLNIAITPHISWAVYESRKRLIDQVAANIAAFLSGNPRNIVS